MAAKKKNTSFNKIKKTINNRKVSKNNKKINISAKLLKEILKIKSLKFTFFQSLFIINRKDRANTFLLQAIFGFFNFILFFSLIASLIIFRNDLLSYKILIVYSLYFLYNIINIILSLFSYLELKKSLNTSEKKYFLATVINGFFGINLFTSIHFYLKSGLSKNQKEKAILMIKKNHIYDIVNKKDVQLMLSEREKKKIIILFQIANDGYEDKDNINSFILKFLTDKGIEIKVGIKNSEIIKYGNYL